MRPIFQWLLCGCLLLTTVGVSSQDLGENIGGLLGTDATPADESEAPPAQSIEARSSPADDAAIEERLKEIFSELGDLQNIGIEVTSGVVTLSGEAASSSAATRAVALARQVQSVVEVVDDTRVDASISRRLGTTLERLRTTALSVVAQLPLLLLALLIVWLFWWIGRRVGTAGSLFRSFAPNLFIAELMTGALRLVIVLIGVVLALLLLDATSIIGTVLGAAGIVGLALGFAVRDTVENYIASILLSLRHPFKARDLVSIDGIEGYVARLTSRATILISIDGNHVRIPNANVYKAVIVNYTRNPHRRFEFVVGVDTDLALQPAQELARKTIAGVDGVLADPPPQVIVDALGDSNVSIRIFCWSDQNRSDFLKVRSEAIRLVKRAYDEAGIVMPEPIYRVKVSSSTQALLAGDTASTSASTSASASSAPESDPPAAVTATITETEVSADTSNDSGTLDTLEKEIREGGEGNLLSDDTRTE